MILYQISYTYDLPMCIEELKLFYETMGLSNPMNNLSKSLCKPFSGDFYLRVRLEEERNFSS